MGFVGAGFEAVVFKLLHRGGDFGDLPAKVVEAFAVFIEEGGDGVIGAERFDELELEISHVEMGETDAGAF